jgi:hypothetical protein
VGGGEGEEGREEEEGKGPLQGMVAKVMVVQDLVERILQIIGEQRD